MVDMALWIALGAAVLALAYGAFSAKWVMAQPAGNEKMQSIAMAIQEGAKAYMHRQYRAISMVGLVLLVILWITLGNLTAIGFDHECRVGSVRAYAQLGWAVVARFAPERVVQTYHPGPHGVP